ncbi:hypothetical protein [Caulobacter sp. FWC26]|uniref:hypothetical protein n=1 Tax=Caulobacter sp. FWC26 TaxID=69665 RepID=UPI000FD98323|nr:hypothetical protein [Caulobacter sp. FWC26]
MVEWIAGLVLLAIGIAGILWIERRRFYRRNPAGLQVYRSFGASLTTGTFETVALLIFRLVALAGLSGLALGAFKTFG